MSSPFSRVEPGAVVAGRWHVTQIIGQGDLGQVFEVLDGPAGRVYALKLFLPDALRGNAWQEYQALARSASSIAVDTISKVHELGIDPALEAPFAVGERILWPSLDEELRSSRPFALKRVATILELLAPALDSAHLAGLVHRDLRPSNVFTAKHVATGARITDFGVRTLRAAVAPPPGWAAPAGWAAPDAIDRSMAPTPTMDVFALGTLAFFLLTGKNPFRAMQARPLDHKVLWNELISPLPAASERARELGASLPTELDPWFATALALHPKARFSSVAEMAKAFVTTSGGAQAPSPTAPTGAAAMKRTALGLGAPAIAAPAPPRPAGAPTPIAPAGAPPPVGGSGASGAKVPRVGTGPAAAVGAPPIAPAPVAVLSPPTRSPGFPPLPAPRLGKQTMLGLGSPDEIAPRAAPFGPVAADPVFDDETVRTQTPLGLGDLAHAALDLGEHPTSQVGLRATRLGLGSPGDSVLPDSAPPFTVDEATDVAAPAPSAAAKASPPKGDSTEPPRAPAMMSYRPPAPSTSDSGPIALASAKPLAFMPDFPAPPALAKAAKEHAARAAMASTGEPALPKQRALILPLLALGGVLVAVVGGAFIMFARPKPAESGAPPRETTAEAPIASTPSPAPVEAPNSQESAPSDPDRPAPSESAEALPSDALVMFNCKPACEVIECDGNKLPSPADGVRLSDGPHVCKASREGYLVKTVKFTVDAGKDQTRNLALIKLVFRTEPEASRERVSSKSAATPKAATPAKGKPKPCGTFINPCK